MVNLRSDDGLAETVWGLIDMWAVFLAALIAALRTRT
jgi:hypothetical protein